MAAPRFLPVVCAVLSTISLWTGPTETARAAGFVDVEVSQPVDTRRIEVGYPDGRKSSLEDALPSGPAIVHFWAMWCVPCREELPKLAAYRDALAAKGHADRLVIVALEKGDHARIETFLAEKLNLAGLPSLRSGDGRAGPAFGLFGMPATALIDGKRHIVMLGRGPVEWEDEGLRARLERHLSGKK